MQKIKQFAKSIFIVPERFFVLSAGFFGIVFILLTPPMQTPDEAAHFLRTYQISQFQLTPDVKGNTVGGYLPKSIGIAMNIAQKDPVISFYPNVKYNIHKTAAALKIPLNKNDKAYMPGITNYSPVGYIPQALLVMFGSLFNLPAMFLIYLARLGSLVGWLIIMGLAIRITPLKKWAFVGLGLLPMLIAQSISPGIDALSISLSVLFIASILRIRQMRIVSPKVLTALIVLGTAIVLTKQTSVLVLAFALLLKNKQLNTPTWVAVVKKISIIIIPVAVFIAWGAIASRLGLNVSSSVAGQDSSAQLTYLLHNPFYFIGVLFDTFFTTWGDGVVQSFIGSFGWTDAPLPGFAVSFGYVFIVLTLFVNYEKSSYVLTKKAKSLMLALASIYAVGTCAALYLIYSPVRFSIIYGLQGRYFLLALFILIPVFTHVRLRASLNSYRTMIMSLSTALLVISAVTIYLRFYVRLF